ncbi:hypothetical protein TNCV_1496052 [Trichonephila clavipes]|nr:hypothetical protein TNCV_1496052 [Trichonephila clavipes]
MCKKRFYVYIYFLNKLYEGEWASRSTSANQALLRLRNLNREEKNNNRSTWLREKFSRKWGKARKETRPRERGGKGRNGVDIMSGGASTGRLESLSQERLEEK